MATPNMQKQTSRYLVASPNAQTSYGTPLADTKLTRMLSVDASSVFMNPDKRYSDGGAVGHGTDYATTNVRTAWNTMATVKGFGGVDAWLLGLMMAMIFGTDTVTGSASPYTHTFSMAMNSALAPCTTFYIQDTNDVTRNYPDMSAKSLSIDIPERGPLQASLDLIGTGLYVPHTMSALPAPVVPNLLLGSDIVASFNGVSFPGRLKTASIKVDRGTAPFESAGDGLTAGSNQYGKLKFSVDMTVMAQNTDDVNGFYENMSQGALSLASNTARTYQAGFNFPAAIIKANKLGNVQDLVAWQLSFDETSMLQVGTAAALSAFIINTCPAYLIPG